MEKQLFDWQGVDVLDTACLIFYKVKTKVKIQSWDVGTHFDSVIMDYQEGTITFENSPSTMKFKLSLIIEDGAIEMSLPGKI